MSKKQHGDNLRLAFCASLICPLRQGRGAEAIEHSHHRPRSLRFCGRGRLIELFEDVADRGCVGDERDDQHRNAYSVLFDAAANRQCWTCLFDYADINVQ